MRIIIFVLTILVVALSNACVTYDKLVTYQSDKRDSIVLHQLTVPELKLKPNDIISISVYGTNQELAEPFNLKTEIGNNINAIEGLQLIGYLIDKEGNIDFPVLGKIHLEGLSPEECKRKIADLLQEYLVDPVVMVRMLNFQVTVSGEVNQPGTYSVLNERITLSNALAMAGGMTDYANRSNVLVLREDNGFLSLNRVNMQKKEFYTSDYYFLKQNDVIYIEPLKSKVGAVTDRSNRIFPIISALGTIAAIAIALFK